MASRDLLSEATNERLEEAREYYARLAKNRTETLEVYRGSQNPEIQAGVPPLEHIRDDAALAAASLEAVIARRAAPEEGDENE